MPNDIPVQIYTTNVFQLPQVCSFQEVSYTIALQHVDAEGNAVIVVGSKIVQPYSMQQLLASVQEIIHEVLVMNARYSVVLSVNTSGGMNTSSQLFFVGKYNVMNVQCAPINRSVATTTNSIS